MTVNDWYSIAQVGSAVTLFLTFVFGALAIISGLRVNKASAAQILALETRLAESTQETERIKAASAVNKQESDHKIAELNKQTAGLTTEAAQARASIAASDARVKEAESRIASAIASVKAADARIAEAQRAAADANRIAETERLERLKLEEKVAWRRLSDAQQVGLGNRLIRFSGQLVNCAFLSNDMEAFSFSSDLASALRKAGWRVVPPSPNVITIKEASLPTTNSPIEKLDVGVEVVSTPDANSVSAARSLVVELERLGFDAEFKPTPQHQDAPWVWMTVQHRPSGSQGEAKLRSK